MSTKTFDRFVQRRLKEAQAEDSSKKVDWGRTRDDWILSLRDLYASMEKYLKKYTETGQIHVARDKIQISEEYLGSYEVETITFQIGNDKVVAKPIGARMIGAAGRVDLIGARGTLRLVFLEKKEPTIRNKTETGGRPEEDLSRPPTSTGDIDKSGWYIATLPPRVATTPLSGDSFRDALMELSDV